MSFNKDTIYYVYFSFDVPSKISGQRFMEFAPRDAHKNLKDRVPHIFKDVKLENGDGGIGTVRHICFHEGEHFEHMKMHTDHIDMDKNEFDYHLTEGGQLGTKFSSANYKIRMVKLDNGTWIYRHSGELVPLPDAAITKKDIEKERELWQKCFQGFEEYLLSNPHHYPEANK